MTSIMAGQPDPSLSPDWARLAFDAKARLDAVRGYAIKVFGKETAASVWLGRTSPAILGGSCVISEACETTEGFLEAMAELARFERAKNAP